MLQHPGLDAGISTGKRPVASQGVAADIDGGGVLEQIERSRLPLAGLGGHQVLPNPRQLAARQPHDRQPFDRLCFQDGAAEVEPRHRLRSRRHVQVVQGGGRESLQVVPASFPFEVAHGHLARVPGLGQEEVHGHL